MPLLNTGESAVRRLPYPAVIFQRLRCLVINRVEWPESEYLVDWRRKFLYCPIAKVACSSIKRWFLALNDERLAPGRDEHVAVQRHRLRELSAVSAWQVLGDPSFFRFTFVRNPWARLVSAYLNKFLGPTVFAQRIAARLRPRSALATGPEAIVDVTFAEFVQFLTRGNPLRFDVHWRPQHCYLQDHQFDFIGRFEHLREDFASLQERLGTDVPLTRCNATRYQCSGTEGQLVVDHTPRQLLAMGELPGYRQFYTAELSDTVGRLYATDIRQFGYEFDEG